VTSTSRSSSSSGSRRAAAALVDLACGGLLATLLARTTGLYFAERAVVTLRIGEPGTLWQGPLPMVLGIFGELVYGLPFALAVVALAGAAIGVSPGRAACGLEVRGADGRALSRLRRLGRSLVTTAGLWLLVAALAAGSGAVAVVGALVTAAILVDGALGLRPRGTRLVDRWTRTIVVRREPAAGPAANRAPA